MKWCCAIALSKTSSARIFMWSPVRAPHSMSLLSSRGNLSTVSLFSTDLTARANSSSLGGWPAAAPAPLRRARCCEIHEVGDTWTLPPGGPLRLESSAAPSSSTGSALISGPSPAASPPARRARSARARPSLRARTGGSASARSAVPSPPRGTPCGAASTMRHCNSWCLSNTSLRPPWPPSSSAGLNSASGSLVPLLSRMHRRASSSISGLPHFVA
mmetsp:Transcript_107950/g.305202  ORF Transcript_107950/g.305202 Transcript_107950/m.305202 type:complete len:216 (-) Transcript_107950:36-683(-)